MTSAWARLNLRPEERRLIVVVAAVLFIVLNVWLVWPHYRDWRRLQADLTKARATLANYQSEVGAIPKYRQRLKDLESQGSAVLPAEQALLLTRTVQNQAVQSGVMIVQTTPLQTPRGAAANTNQFFEEQAIKISVNSDETNLVNFLYAIGSGNSMIRVRDLDLRPDPGSGRTRLVGGITLVASYQKKIEPRPELKTNASRIVEPKKKAPPTNPPGTAGSRKPDTRTTQPSPAPKTPPTTRKP